MKRKIAVILASDVSSYSRLIAVDEEATLSRFDAAAKLFKDLVARYKGRVFNTAGDAILAEFDSAVVAVRCALHIQYATEALDPSTPLDQRLRFRMGIAMGDVVITDNEDLLGDSVNIAARLEGLAEPGGICVAKDIQAAVAGKIKVEFTDLGEKALKNIPRPVQVFRLKAMPTTRVLIATTVGPVQIDSIIEEDKRVPKSLACIANTSNRSSIDTAYAAFVARGTGVIERLYAPGPYRLDISADITKDSASWQLGVFVAHALYANGRLASEKQDAGTVVWATGQVRPLDLSVTGVGYVGQKIRLSLAQLRTEAEAGRKIIAAWPKVNTTDIDPDILEELEKLGAKLFDLESINPILPALGLPSHAANPEKGTWQGSPFRGLEPFDESHRDVFFGRGRAREEALERLRTAAAQDCAFLLVHGRSGAGKSSLVRAGMIGDIAASASEARVWRHTVFRPGGAGSVSRRWNKASRKVAVLPVPVCAWPATSLPASSTGRAFSWMSVQWVKPAAATFAFRRGSNGSASNGKPVVWAGGLGAGRGSRVGAVCALGGDDCAFLRGRGGCDAGGAGGGVISGFDGAGARPNNALTAEMRRLIT